MKQLKAALYEVVDDIQQHAFRGAPSPPPSLGLWVSFLKSVRAEWVAHSGSAQRSSNQAGAEFAFTLLRVDDDRQSKTTTTTASSGGHQELEEEFGLCLCLVALSLATKDAELFTTSLSSAVELTHQTSLLRAAQKTKEEEEKERFPQIAEVCRKILCYSSGEGCTARRSAANTSSLEWWVRWIDGLSQVWGLATADPKAWTVMDMSSRSTNDALDSLRTRILQAMVEEDVGSLARLLQQEEEPNCSESTCHSFVQGVRVVMGWTWALQMEKEHRTVFRPLIAEGTPYGLPLPLLTRLKLVSS